MLILFDIFLVYHSISAGEKHNMLGFRLELCRICSKSVENWRRDDAEPFSARMQDSFVGGGPFTSQRRVVVLFPAAPLEHVTCSEVPHLFVL